MALFSYPHPVALRREIGYIGYLECASADGALCRQRPGGLLVLRQQKDLTIMGLRPRTTHVMKLKARKCGKCGGKINSQQVRCRRCHATQVRPVKTGNS
jgi:hypothetical protein